MPFVADNGAMRTHDPERGIDLVYDRRMSDGTTFFRLVKGDRFLHFVTHWDPEREDLVRAQEGPADIVYLVSWRGTCFDDYSEAATKQLIEEALVAFKGMHGRQAHETVLVKFL